jgi:hypothetical protein
MLLGCLKRSDHVRTSGVDIAMMVTEKNPLILFRRKVEEEGIILM